MRVLITGAAGMLGRIVAPALAEHELLLTDLPDKGLEVLDVTDARAVREAVGWCDVVIHCAVAGGQCNDWGRQSRANAMRRVHIDCGGTLNVLWAAAELGKRAIYVSSINAVEYDSLGQYVTDQAAPSGAAVYGLTKTFGEKCARELHKDLGLRVAVVRPGGFGFVSEEDYNSSHSGMGMARPRAWCLGLQDCKEGMAAITRGTCEWSLTHLVSDTPGRRWSISRLWEDFAFWPKWQMDSRGYLHRFSELEGSLPLRVATSNGDMDTVRCLIEAGADPNQYGGDPLRQIAGTGRIEAFEAMLKLGADPSIDDGQSLSWAVARKHDELGYHILGMGVSSTEELSVAVWHAALTDNTEMVRHLLEAGADPDFGYGELMRIAVMQDGYGARLGNADIVDLLLRAGYHWVCPLGSNNGVMPLELALEIGSRIDVIRTLLRYGADPRGVANNFARHAAKAGRVEELHLVGRDEKGEELSGADSPDAIWQRYLQSSN